MQPLTYQQTSGFIPTAVINRSQTKQAPGHEKIRDAVRAWSAVDNQDVVAALIVNEYREQGDGTIDGETAIAARKWMDIDELGLDELDRSVLRAIIEMYGGGPVGLETLAAALGEESVTLEDICEPYLMQMGMLTRTPRGRCVTRLAYEHLHMAVPKRFDDEDSGQTSMF